MTGTGDPFDLQRFVDAQDPVVAQVRAELTVGRKASHWMWFVFPQLAGLGRSLMAQTYAISGLAEGEAYLRHAALGPRLREFTALAIAAPVRRAEDVFGWPDDRKFQSSMTLFAQAAASNVLLGEALFQKALGRFFDGVPDPETLRRLQEPLV
ncbi:MAG TPA: DUF1810 domain-containing protein [Caulobacteraceae bacterium]